jgi:hypothetical protein
VRGFLSADVKNVAVVDILIARMCAVVDILMVRMCAVVDILILKCARLLIY